MEAENNSPSNIPDACTHEQCLEHVRMHSRLPASAVLRTASAAEVGKIVGCTVLAPFLKDFFPAVFGAFGNLVSTLPHEEQFLRISF